MPYNRPAAMRVLHQIGARRGLDHEALRDIAISIFSLPEDRRSLGALDNFQLGRLIEHIKAPNAASAAPIPVPGGPTTRQAWLIKKLADELGWTPNPDRLAGFIARQCRGKRQVSDLKVYEASRVIEGLKHLLSHPED